MYTYVYPLANQSAQKVSLHTTHAVLSKVLLSYFLVLTISN